MIRLLRKDLKSLEEYTREVTGKPFELISTNGTESIYTDLKIDEELKDFYFKLIEPPYKTQSTLI